MQLQALKHIILGLALIASVVQSLGMSALRVAQLDGYESSILICASPGKVLSEDAIRASNELAKLLGQSEPTDTLELEHCADCVMTGFAILRDVSALIMVQHNAASLYRPPMNPAQFAHKPHGPPLGGRAPPAFI